VLVEAPEELPPLPAAVEVAIYRITQGALTNVVRHAQAQRCVVRLTVKDDASLEITDNGVGFLAECAPQAQASPRCASARQSSAEPASSS
jgi:signal transduction histidine kinase